MSSSTVIQVEDLSKQYRLGQVGKKTLHDDLNRFMHRIIGKEDPYLKIGEVNDRSTKGNSEYVWALRDINFGVQQGDILGIIGRNGAGKSTLLKILSKVTTPTTGNIKIKGRIAALLEVGTGFHPELSGRDNIFLNGAILGMTKIEIRRKFDEIVAFAGVERYIDTPVKRYSSGMYVRLAFAVAAHLEPDILIVDEVLAVGDAEFQKKCLGKMKDVSEKEGRTVLFVSHNMGAIQQLTNQCLFLQNGLLLLNGNTADVVHQYLSSLTKKTILSDAITKEPHLRILSFSITRESESFNDPISFVLRLECLSDIRGINIGIGVCAYEGTRLFTTFSKIDLLKRGNHELTITPEANYLPPAEYVITLGINLFAENIYYNDAAVNFEIDEKNIKDEFIIAQKNKMGLFIPNKIRTTNF